MPHHQFIEHQRVLAITKKIQHRSMSGQQANETKQCLPQTLSGNKTTEVGGKFRNEWYPRIKTNLEK